MKRLHILFCFIFFLVAWPILAQENASSGNSDQSKSTPEGKRAKRKKAKKEWQERRVAERDEQKAIKEHHKKIQSKETRKRMKESKKKSARINANKRDPFFKRLFKRKKRR